jgi:hypothetical protein
VRQAFPLWPLLTETHLLCHTYSCHEILRVETPGQDRRARAGAGPGGRARAGGGGGRGHDAGVCDGLTRCPSAMPLSYCVWYSHRRRHADHQRSVASITSGRTMLRARIDPAQLTIAPLN